MCIVKGPRTRINRQKRGSAEYLTKLLGSEGGFPCPTIHHKEYFSHPLYVFFFFFFFFFFF